MTDVFAIDDQGAQALEDEARANPLDPALLTPALWDNTLPAVGKGFVRGSGAAYFMAGAPGAVLEDKLTGTTRGTDAHFRRMEHFLDDWTPDARTTGAAGNVLGGLAGILPPLLLSRGNPAAAAFGTTAVAASEPGINVVRQGGSADVALQVAAIQGAANLAGFKIPILGKTLAARLATGAAGNVAIDLPASMASADALDAAGEHDLADQYRPTGESAVISALVGTAFGGFEHLTAPKAQRMTPSQRAAALAANNADHFANGTLPGAPMTPGAGVQHQDAMETALRQMIDGAPVNVAGKVDLAQFDLRSEFMPAPAAPASGAFDAAVARVLDDEGGYVDDPADRGGATRFGISSAAHPDVDLASLTQDQARAIYRSDYWDAIDADALPADLQGMAFDAAVNQGVGWTKQALAAADGDPAEFLQLREQHYRAIVASDPSQAKFLRGWLNRLGRYKETSPAGEALRARLLADPDALTRDYAALKDSKGGTVLNTDTARELSPEYLADRTRSADVHEAASDTVKTIYEAKLAQPTPDGLESTVMFTAGGTGAGKTSSVQAAGEAFGKPEIVYDTNMSTLASAVEKVDQALAAGRDVHIVYVYRDPVESLTGGAIPRAVRQKAEFGTGRTVPLDEHAKTHLGARPVMEQLAEHYQGNARVETTAIDNSRGHGKSKIVPLESLPRVAENNLRERLQAALEEARGAGLDESLYQGFGAQGRPVAQGSVRAARAGDGGRPEPAQAERLDPAEALDAAGFEKTADTIAAPGTVVRVVRVAPAGDETLANRNAANIHGMVNFLAEVDDFDSSINALPESSVQVWEYTAPADKPGGYATLMGGKTRLGDKVVDADHYGRGQQYGGPQSVWYSFGATVGGEARLIGELPLRELRDAYADTNPDPKHERKDWFDGVEGEHDFLESYLARRFPAAAAASQVDAVAFPVQGSDATVVTERGLRLPVRYAVVDVADLVTSHDDALNVNPDFPAELQPRDRARAASEQQITRIANALNPELLAESPKAADGAPIVGQDQVVESGNARTIAVRRAYTGGKADAYRQFLIDEAARFGLDAAGIDAIAQPVLVRVALGEYDRADFARQANESTVAAMSTTEQALADARHLPDMGGLQTNDDGTINMRASARFVGGFIEGVGPNERASMATADGDLSQQGQARIRNAVFARAYGDADLVALMAEATDANVKNVLSGMLRAAPAIARLREMIDEGGRFGPDIAPDLVAAVRKFSQLRSEGTTVEQFEAQGDFFGSGGLTPKARDLLHTVGENARAPKRMAEFLQRYVDAVEALGDPRQADLMGGPKADAVDTAAQATRAANAAPAPKAGSLFNAAGRPTADAKPTITPDNRAAYEAIAAMPDLQILGDDGVLRPAADVLADADADAAQTAETVQAVQAAANCFLRNAA